MTIVRRLLILLFLLALPCAAWASTPVTLGIVTWVGYGPIYCAAANGDFAKRGLDVKIVNFADNAVMPGAVQGGEVDAATLTYDQVVGSVAKGWPIKAVLAVDYSAGGDAILAVNGIASIKDIKGHKVAYGPLSPSDFLLGYALEKNGLTQKDIIPINTTAEGVPGILAGGSADVGVSYEPSVSVILRSGGGKRFHVLLSSREAIGIITDTLALTDATIKKKPKMVDGLIRAYLDGVSFMAKEPDKAAAIIAKALDVDPEDAKSQMQSIQNPTLAQIGDVFVKSDALPSFYASGRTIGSILKKEGQIDAEPAIEATFDASFVKGIQAHPGG